MKITILGSGSAYGLPMVFNTWGSANPTNPKNRRTRASLLLEDAGKNILIDCGPDFREQVNQNNVKNIDAVLITHCHYDHISGIPELPRAAKLLGHSIEIYAAEKTMQGIKESYGYLFADVADAEPDKSKIIWKSLPDDGIFTVCSLEFQTTLFPHHHIFSSAFRYKDFAYVTDWQALSPQAENMLQNLKVLLVECNNGYETLENGHSDMDNIKNLMQKFNPQKTILSHLSARIDYDKFELPANCELSYDGMQIEL